MDKNKYLTKSQLRIATGAPGYVIDYINDCNRLPIIRKSRGKGYPNFYHPDAIQIVIDHLRKQGLDD